MARRSTLTSKNRFRGTPRVLATDAVHSALEVGARVMCIVTLLLLFVLWLLPMPNRDALPGRAPRVLVGA